MICLIIHHIAFSAFPFNANTNMHEKLENTHKHTHSHHSFILVASYVRFTSLYAACVCVCVCLREILPHTHTNSCDAIKTKNYTVQYLTCVRHEDTERVRRRDGVQDDRINISSRHRRLHNCTARTRLSMGRRRI